MAEERFLSSDRAKPDCIGAEMPEQVEKRDTEADTPLRGLEPMEEPMPKLVTKREEATKSKEPLTPVSGMSITSHQLKLQCVLRGLEANREQRCPEGS